MAYADDVTLLAADRTQAAEMLKDLSKALQGINLELRPDKCSAQWTQKPDGSESDEINFGEARISINASLTILGQEIAFRRTRPTVSNTD